MAITKPVNLSKTATRRWRMRLIWTVLALVAMLAWFWRPIVQRAQVGAAYGAHVACSCRFIGGRELASCRDDFEPGMGLLMLNEDVEAKSVTARFPLLARQSARYFEGQGCLLEAWKD